MAGGAEAWIGARFLGVARHEAGAMEPRQANVVPNGQLPRQRRNRPLAVARRALSLGVAARAEVAGARRTDTVLPDEVSVVNEVIVGGRTLGGQIDVAAAAIAQRPLIAVLVASKAGGHLRQDGLRTSLGHLGMAVHAIALGGDHVPRVLEAKLSARQLRHLAHVRFAMALHAGSVVMGLLMAPPTVGVGGKMKRPGLTCRRDTRVALDAVDPFQNVRTVLERVRRALLTKTEHAGASRQRDGQHHEQREARPHRDPAAGATDGPSKARERRTIASAS